MNVKLVPNPKTDITKIATKESIESAVFVASIVYSGIILFFLSINPDILKGLEIHDELCYNKRVGVEKNEVYYQRREWKENNSKNVTRKVNTFIKRNRPNLY